MDRILQSYSPMPKFLGRFSNRGLETFLSSGFFTARGAAATFLPTFFLGCEQAVRNTLRLKHKHNEINRY